MSRRPKGQGTIRERHGRFLASIRIDGLRYWKTFEKKSDAATWMATLKADSIRGTLGVDPPKPAITFENLARAYKVEKMGEWRQGSLDYFRCHVERYLVPLFRGRLIDSIDRKELQALLHEKRATVKASTVNKVHQNLTALFKFAVNHDWLDRSPMLGVSRSRERKEDEFDPRVLTLLEVRAFFEACLPADRPFFMILLFTGLRRSEIFRMTWDWVNLRSKTLKVKLGKTGIDTIPLAEPAFKAFLELNPKSEGVVFPGRKQKEKTVDPAKPLTNKFKAIRGTLKRAGIDPTSIALHSFRRTFITLLEATGSPYGVVRTLARHTRKGKDITARYLVPTDEQLRAGLAQLAAAIFGSSEESPTEPD